MYLEKKLCVSCQKSIAKQSKSDDALVELEQIDSDPDYVNDNTDVNSQLENIHISPISNHAKVKSTRISTGKRKLSQINDALSVSVSKKLNLSCEETSEQNSTVDNHCVDCKDYKQILENIKEKINTVPKRKQIPLLKLAPESWTQQKISSFFNAKLYSVRKAASLKKDILPKVTRKKGHQLDDDVINLVKHFYEDVDTQECARGLRSINL